jgi:predicted transcriptional regulator
MTDFRNILVTLFILTLFISCGGQTDNNNPTQKENPKALQDAKLNLKSYSRSSDLIEDIYLELVDNTPALRKLEEDLDAFRPKPDDLKAKFNQFDYKSNNYYNSANNKALTIKDSLLKKKIIGLITSSNNKYSSKTSELNSLLKQITNNDTSLNDHHSVLKIVLTLPIIEKFQDNNMPNHKEFKDLINQQEKLILRTDSLTTKY